MLTPKFTTVLLFSVQMMPSTRDLSHCDALIQRWEDDRKPPARQNFGTQSDDRPFLIHQAVDNAAPLVLRFDLARLSARNYIFYSFC